MQASKRKVLVNDLSSLLQVVFAQIVTSADASKNVYIDVRRGILHPFFFRLKSEFGKDFPELEVLFVVAAPWPYSHELMNAFWELSSSDICTYIGDIDVLNRWDDTEEWLAEEIKRRFGGDEKKQNRFNEMVKRFEEITNEG